MNNLRAALVLTFQDNLTAGLRKVKEQLDGLKRLGREMSMPGLNAATRGLHQATGAATGLSRALHGVGGSAKAALGQVKRLGIAVGAGFKRLGAIGSRIGPLGGLIGGAAVLKPLEDYSSYENVLRQIAVVEGKHGAAVAQEISRLNQLLTHDALRSGQRSADLARAYKFLITTGMSPALVNKLIPIHSEVATAYSIDPDAMGQAVFALADTLKIPASQMEGALAAMALASKHGHFGMEAMSRFMPQIAGQMALLGISGRAGLNVALADLETVIKNSADPGTAATNYSQLLSYLTAPIAARSFAGNARGIKSMPPALRELLTDRLKDKGAQLAHGLDLVKLFRDAGKHGINPLDALVDKVMQMTQGLGPVDRAELIGSLFHNQEAATALRSLVAHREQDAQLRQVLAAANTGTLTADFATSFKDPVVQLRLIREMLAQVTRRLGQGFLPVLAAVNVGLSHTVHFLDWANAAFPRTTKWVLGITGAILALGAAVGILTPVFRGLGIVLGLAADVGALAASALGIVASIVEGVVAVLGGPLTAVLVLVAGAAYDIWSNWAQFRPLFLKMWQGLEEVLRGVAGVLTGIANFNLATLERGLAQIGGGLVKGFAGAIDTVERLLMDLVAWLTGWTDKQLGKIARDIESTLMAPFHEIARVIGPAHPADVFHGHAGHAGSAGAAAALFAPRAVQHKVLVGVDPHSGRIHLHHPAPPSAASARPDTGLMLGFD